MASTDEFQRVIGDHHQISVLNMNKISETTNRIALNQKLPESMVFPLKLWVLLVTVPWTYPAKTLHYVSFENLCLKTRKYPQSLPLFMGKFMFNQWIWDKWYHMVPILGQSHFYALDDLGIKQFSSNSLNTKHPRKCNFPPKLWFLGGCLTLGERDSGKKKLCYSPMIYSNHIVFRRYFFLSWICRP